MRKPLKTKKDRVPKITEEEYANYISSLKSPPTEKPVPVKEETNKKEM